jgi:ribosomal protein L7/L12
MGNGSFWIFAVIVIANLVITAIKRSAEKKAAAAAGNTAKRPVPKRVALSGKGDLEVILERVGERSFDVMSVLRETAGMSLDAASEACTSPPALVGTNLTRSEAGMIRQALEGVGAGSSIRRMQRSSFETAVVEPVQAVERTLERAIRSVERSIDRAVEPSKRKASRVPAATRTGRAASRIEALRMPPAAPAAAPPPRLSRQDFVPRAETTHRTPSAEAVANTSTPLRPLPEIGNRPSKAREGSAAALRLRDLLGRKAALRDAFILQELLRPPLSQRPGGTGGRLS